VQPRWRVYGWCFLAGLIGSAVATFLRSPFWLAALPIAIGSTLPLLHVVAQAFRLPKDSLTVMGRAAVLSLGLFAIHLLDYPFLRTHPDFAAPGFIVAILATFAISITAPAIIFERLAAERLQMEQQVLRLNDELKLRVEEALGAVRARDEFLGVASHELRTPLTALRLQTQLALRSAGAGAGAGGVDLAPRLEIIDRQTGRLQRLIHQLLDVSRITSRRLELDYSQADFSAVVEEIAHRMQPELDQAGSSLRLVSPGPLWGSWDVSRLDQVVVNLLSNAAKFGAGKPIELHVDDAGDAVRLTIADGGLGISIEDQARLFQPFERASSARNYGGLGLGLWICSQIVAAHGGTIAVASQPGQGAEFTVVIPKAPAATEHAPAALPH
jgi:signal transduction histidine kinase